MFKKIVTGFIAALVVSSAFAGTWLKVRGSTIEEAFYKAQQQYGSKFVKRGSCTTKQNDGYFYCDALIEN